MNDTHTPLFINMYPILLQSGANDYLLGEFNSINDKERVISELPPVIQTCLSLNVLFEKESVRVEKESVRVEKESRITVTGPSIRVKAHDVFYTLPYHDSFTQMDYIVYWFLLYICEKASEVYGTPEKMFVGWIYDMLDTIFNQVEWDDNSLIYPGSLWVLEESEHVFREHYVFRVVQPVG
jgi:hypothetical protein